MDIAYFYNIICWPPFIDFCINLVQKRELRLLPLAFKQYSPG